MFLAVCWCRCLLFVRCGLMSVVVGVCCVVLCVVVVRCLLRVAV